MRHAWAVPPVAKDRVDLLPSFDEYLLGWRDRSLIVDHAHARAVQPGGGILRPTVVTDGRVVGRWRTGLHGIELFGDAVTPAGLADEIADIRQFSG